MHYFHRDTTSVHWPTLIDSCYFVRVFVCISKIHYICLRSRPVSPNVVHPLVSDNVENSDQMTADDWPYGIFTLSIRDTVVLQVPKQTPKQSCEQVPKQQCQQKQVTVPDTQCSQVMTNGPNGGVMVPRLATLIYCLLSAKQTYKS